MRREKILAAAILLAATLTLVQYGAAAATDAGGVGVRGAAAQGVPADPSGLTAEALSTSSIRIEWTDNSTDEDWFKIEQCQGLGCTDFTLIGYIAASGTNATVSNLAKNKTYTYRVCASNSVGDSGYSNTASATTLR